MFTDHTTPLLYSFTSGLAVPFAESNSYKSKKVVSGTGTLTFSVGQFAEGILYLNTGFVVNPIIVGFTFTNLLLYPIYPIAISLTSFGCCEALLSTVHLNINRYSSREAHCIKSW